MAGRKISSPAVSPHRRSGERRELTSHIIRPVHRDAEGDGEHDEGTCDDCLDDVGRLELLKVGEVFGEPAELGGQV